MKTGFIITLLIALLSSGGFAQTQKLNLAADVWPPFTNYENEKAVAIDLVKRALERTGVKAEFKIENFDDVLYNIKNDVYDGSPAIWETEKRRKKLFFSAPYLENQLILVGMKGADVDIKNVSGLKGKKVGIVKDYAYGDNLLKAKGVELEISNNDQENLEKLFDHKIDLMLVDELLIQYMLKFQMNDVNKYLEISETPFETKKLYFVLNKKVKNAKEIINRFNNEIELMIKDGTYNEILGVDWIEADINHDGVTELIFKGDAAGEEEPGSSYHIFQEEHHENIGGGYYMNGKHYKTWEEVPDEYKYKKRGRIQISNDIYNPGIWIKIR